MPKITDAKILIIATHGFRAVRARGAPATSSGKGETRPVHVASPRGEDITGWDTDGLGPHRGP